MRISCEICTNMVWTLQRSQIPYWSTNPTSLVLATRGLAAVPPLAGRPLATLRAYWPLHSTRNTRCLGHLKRCPLRQQRKNGPVGCNVPKLSHASPVQNAHAARHSEMVCLGCLFATGTKQAPPPQTVVPLSSLPPPSMFAYLQAKNALHQGWWRGCRTTTYPSGPNSSQYI